MYFIKAFFKRISKDFKQKELLPLKLLFFVHASTLFVLYPYLTIHMRELGINVEETAIMSAVTPVVAIIMPPLAGMVADHIGNFRILMSIFSTIGGGASLLLLLVPVGRVTITYPDKMILHTGCGQNGVLEFVNSGNEPCNFVSSFKNGEKHQIPVTLEACGFLCHQDIGGQIVPMLSERYDDKNISYQLPRTKNYDVIISDTLTNTFSYSLTSEQMPEDIKDKPQDDLRNHLKLKNNEFYRTSVRKISNNSFFFPTTGLYNFSCELVNSTLFTTYQCKFGEGLNVQEGVSKIKTMRKHFTANLFLSDNKNTFLASTISNWTDNNYHFNSTCEDMFSQNKQKVSISVPVDDRIIQLSSCTPRCLLTTPRKEVCSNMKVDKEFNVSLTFWSYLVIRVFIGMIGGTAFAMFEGAVIAILREQNADYGLQRIYATIGGMISSPLSGLLIDYASKGKGYTDFRPAFYLYAGLKTVSGLLMLTINLEFKAPARNVLSDVMSVLKNIEILALFIAIFVLGTAWGYIESFLFWLLQDLGGSRSLMGITITVGGIAGIPLLVLSGPIIDRIGHANVLFIGFIFYAIRLLGYSLIYNPWHCLFFEAMESVTSSLSFTAAVTYAAKLSTTTTDTSIQGLLGGIYFGVGKGAGSLFGGYMMKAFDTRPTYRIFAVMCTITGAVYFLFNKFYLRKRPQVEGNDIVKKKPKPGDMIEIDLTGDQKEEQMKNGTNNNPEDSIIEEKNKKNCDKSIELNTTNEKKKDSDETCKNEIEEYNDNLAYNGDEDNEVKKSKSIKVQSDQVRDGKSNMDNGEIKDTKDCSETENVRENKEVKDND